jgi:hypothetical protein
MNQRFVTVALGFALALGSVSASAAPAVVGPRMPVKSYANLKAEIVRARTVDAKSFALVGSIVAHAPEADAKARGGRAATSLTLAQLGPSALLPMLEMLAVDAPKGIADEAAPKVRQSVIEAVGLLRDPKALDVLVPILEDGTEDTATTRSVSEAIARIGTDLSATKLLAALGTATGDRARAIVSGMGDCRRLSVAQALAAQLGRTSDDAMASAAARSLGRIGNAWAWKTVADHTEEMGIRHAAAASLVQAYARFSGDARQAASNALMVVDSSDTPALIAAAKRGASAETLAALSDLEARFARNPSR